MLFTSSACHHVVFVKRKGLDTAVLVCDCEMGCGSQEREGTARRPIM